ncbi:hypothetical protein MMC10_006141 [Thelotrema lepadinum]|nr:hypothetical protein [Thelotrema lepadinum]
MSLKTLLIVALSCVEARFGQEHPAAIDEISAVTSGGQPGQAATIAGGAISNLLAAANPCTKLQTGDNIIASLGTGADAVKAAQDFIQAEQNFNPFTQSTPTLCSDPTLPSTAILRGIMPLIDPAVGGSDVANQLSAQSLTAPFSSDGMSVAQIFAANGFSNFTTEDLTGTKGAAPGASSVAGSSATSSNATANAAPPSTNSTSTAGSAGACAAAPPAAAATTLSTAIVAATGAATAGSSSALTGTAAQQAAAADPTIGISAKTSLAGVDFGLCVPTMLFAGGLANRKATEFTFQAVDPKISAIQEEALNPKVQNIITNRICDELTNQCQSNQAAKDVCAKAKTTISGLGTKDQSTADAWNQALGF